MKTIRQVGLAFARALRGRLLRTLRAPRNTSRVIGRLALASAILLLSLGAAKAQTATTTTLVSSAPGSSTLPQPVTFTATVSGSGGTPTGSVTFTDTTTSQTLGTVTLSGGQAVLTTSTLTAGTHHIQASYSGDSNFASSSATIDQVVNKALPELTTQHNATPVFSEPLTITAEVFLSPPGPFTPTGTITFSEGGNTLASISVTDIGGGHAQAIFTTKTLSVGTHSIDVNYGGDSNFNSTGFPLPVKVAPADSGTNVTTTSPNPNTFGQPTTFVAAVAPKSPATATPTGNVTFSVDGGAGITIALLNGQATFTVPVLAGGSHTITAAYSGDGNFNGSSGSFIESINLGSSTTTLASSPNPSVAGQPVTFTATVAGSGGTPTGVVTFFADGTSIGTGTLGNNGQAALTIATLAVGNHTITTSYPGDNNFTGSSGGPLTQTVNKNNTTTSVSSSANPSTFGQSVTFTAVLSPVTPIGSTPVPSGTVTFFADGTSIGTGTLGSNGQATFSTSTLAIGSHTITTTYGGDINFNGSNGTLNPNQQVISNIGTTPTTTTLLSSQNPSSVGQPVTFTATVTGNGGTPTGTVTFFVDGGAGTPVALSGGQAAFTTSSLSIGTHNITATYGGDANFAGSTTTTALVQTVNQRPSTTTVASSANPSASGQSVTFTATVTGSGGLTPTGNVTFSVDGSAGPTVNLINGVASFSTAALTIGGHTITAAYNGDVNFTTSSGSLTQNVNKIATTTTVTSSANPSTLGQLVTFTATVAGSGSSTPTGNVTFSIDGVPGTTVNLINGTASFSTAALTLGGHTIAATYNGDVNFATSSGSLTQNVVKRPTATTLTASPNPSTPGQAVTFTAIVQPTSGSGAPTGTVTFKDGGTTIGTGTLGGVGGVQQATFTTSALTPGSHTITAVYNGDPTFTGSTSARLIEQVGAPTDSTRLRQLQISATPIIAQGWAQAVTAAMDDAVGAGFGGNPQALSPAGTGFTYYFNDDAPAQRSAGSDQDSLKRFLAAPNGSAKRFDDDFRALGYAGSLPTKAPPPAASSGTPHDWLAWVTVRGFDFFRGTFGNDLKGDQIDAFAGLTRRLTPNFVVGVLGGYEHFDYSSQAFNGVLKGDGWTAGGFLGWKLSPNIRFDAGTAWSDLVANPVSGTASGHFLGTRWLVQGGLTGTYPWQSFVLEPSARVFALWEHENAYTDSLGTFQPARSFETGRASAGVKAIYPFAWTSSVVALSPYAGLYADYYFSRDDAQTAGLTTVPLLQGWSARLAGGVAATFPGGVSLGAGGEFGGIGSANHIWTWTARGRIPF